MVGNPTCVRADEHHLMESCGSCDYAVSSAWPLGARVRNTYTLTLGTITVAEQNGTVGVTWDDDPASNLGPTPSGPMIAHVNSLVRVADCASST